MQPDNSLKRFFTRQLMRWHQNENDRSLPWKMEKDPYKIWLSEIILQQTRAEQGLPYYLKFTAQYPTVKDLANAIDEEVFRLWQGLGYYNRCKNLLATARFITTQYGGVFPRNHEDILRLKGIGPYTAAAIASFAFGLPHAVVDGNVIRVLSRYLGIEEPFDTTKGKKLFQQLADELLDTENPAGYNQAIMDLGAVVCKPAKPLCGNCPVQKNCFAYQKGLTDTLPVKSKKVNVKSRYFHFLLIQRDDQLWVRKRSGKDIWQNLYEPLLIEADHKMDEKALKATQSFKRLSIEAIIQYKGTIIQKLTHQLIESSFFTTEITAAFDGEEAGEWVPVNELKNIPFPKTLVSFLEKNLYF